MATSGDDAVNPELESFRQQWISDLQSRREDPPTAELRPARRQSIPPPPTHKSIPPAQDDDDDDDDDDGDESGLLPSSLPTAKQPISALDHYEEAMKKEAQGNMGESLSLYRTAYRLDPLIDKTYREKHSIRTFPPPPAAQQPPPQQAPLSLDDLIASFSTLRVEPAPPVIPGDIPPPCPISRLPDELLTHILTEVAVSDVGDFARLSLVCKRLAYLVAAEQRIWKRVCVGSEFGFRGMHRRWAAGIEWEPLDDADTDTSPPMPSGPSLSPSYPSWKAMFRNRPRIRFNGCYISTVNYVRNGQHATNQTVWGGNPILIVTYYRYLRFFRDGSLISLLSTAPPLDVVHHLTRHALVLHRDAAHNAHLPSSLMQHAYRGRWRMSGAAAAATTTTTTAPTSPPLAATTNDEDCENDLFIETEGVAGKYTYRMDLSIQNAGKAAAAAKNTKLVWKGFYCFNKLTGDWGDFHLKNDKPFFFSRVKSYGLGDAEAHHS